MPCATFVGYQTFEGKTGYTFITPSFAGISDDYNIQDIKLISEDELPGYGEINIQIIDAEGNVPEGNTFCWMNEGEGLGDVTVAGWFNEDLETLSTKTFAPSESFLISNSAGGYKIQFAGAVNYIAIPALDGVAGYTQLGNMTPVEKSVQKFIPTANEGELPGYGEVNIQIVDAEGNVPEGNTFCWMNEGEGLGDDTTAGWFEEDLETKATFMVPAGQGFMMSNSAGDYTIAIPATND